MKAGLQRLRTLAGVSSVFVLAGFLFSNTLTDVIVDSLPGPAWEWAWTGILGCLTLLAFIRWNRAFVRSQKQAHRPEQATSLASHRGAIVLVGLDSDSPTGSIARLLHHVENLEYLALIGTAQTIERGVVSRIVANLLPAAGHTLSADRIWINEACVAEVMTDSKNAVAHACTWMSEKGLPASDVVVDITKGRRPMGYGAMLAAMEHDIAVVYLSYEWDHVANRPMVELSEYRVISGGPPTDEPLTTSN